MSIVETPFLKKLIQILFKETKTTRFAVLYMLKDSVILRVQLCNDDWELTILNQSGNEGTSASILL